MKDESDIIPKIKVGSYMSSYKYITLSFIIHSYSIMGPDSQMLVTLLLEKKLCWLESGIVCQIKQSKKKILNLLF